MSTNLCVNLRMPFETAIIERYCQKCTSPGFPAQNFILAETFLRKTIDSTRLS